jgi:2,3-bisphosphoglycerate-dependent phosphoglycerate mutase
MAESTLILLRHGQSQWNASNQFTGWVDVDLTDKGRAEAGRAGELIAAGDRQPDVVYTSLLRRAITTAHLALDVADRLWIPVHRNWRLNERHYGALQGLDKAATKAKYGEEQFMQWRRSYDIPPPPIEKGSTYSQDADPRYADIGGGPLTECLADVVARFAPYYEQTIAGDLKATLDKFKVPAKEQEELMKIVGSTAGDIIEEAPKVSDAPTAKSAPVLMMKMKTPRRRK